MKFYLFLTTFLLISSCESITQKTEQIKKSQTEFQKLEYKKAIIDSVREVYVKEYEQLVKEKTEMDSLVLVYKTQMDSLRQLMSLARRIRILKNNK